MRARDAVERLAPPDRFAASDWTAIDEDCSWSRYHRMAVRIGMMPEGHGDWLTGGKGVLSSAQAESFMGFAFGQSSILAMSTVLKVGDAVSLPIRGRSFDLMIVDDMADMIEVQDRDRNARNRSTRGMIERLRSV